MLAGLDDLNSCRGGGRIAVLGIEISSSRRDEGEDEGGSGGGGGGAWSIVKVTERKSASWLSR